MLKKNNPIYSTGSLIADYMGDIALTFCNKASFDKSYFSIIEGVNQKFINTISDDKKKEIINKFNIPAELNEDEKNYYIFKVNGTYYCKRQIGKYKLYDKIKVHIPNGNWDRLYFEYDSEYNPVSSDENDNVTLPDVIVSVETPGGDDPSTGDIWLVTSINADDFTSLTKDDILFVFLYEEDEQTGIVTWNKSKTLVPSYTPPTAPVVGDYWIRTDQDGNLLKIDICESVEGSTSTWKEIYPENETANNINVIIDVKSPMKIGDYWIKIKDDVTQYIESFNQYTFNEDTNILEWKQLYSAHIPVIYASIDDPAEAKDESGKFLNNIMIGDYWAKTNGTVNENMSAFYERVYSIVDDNEIQQSWKLLYSASNDSTLNVNIEYAILVNKDDVI